MNNGQKAKNIGIFSRKRALGSIADIGLISDFLVLGE
jgi:hypothetical protein